MTRADAGTRTPDPIITSDVLYQLSYVGERRGSYRRALRSDPCADAPAPSSAQWGVEIPLIQEDWALRSPAARRALGRDGLRGDGASCRRQCMPAIAILGASG